MAEFEYTKLIDASEDKAMPITLDTARATQEVTMMLGDEGEMMFGRDEGREFGKDARRARRAARDITVFGRMPVGMEMSDFDALPTREIDIDPATNPGLFADTYNYKKADVHEDVDWLAGEDDETPPVFESPQPEAFPVFKSALKHFQAAESKPRVARIDTDATYGDFVCERAVKEIARRVGELRAVVEEHLAAHEEEEHPGYHKKAKMLRKWDEIVGAAKAVSRIRSAKDASSAADAMPQVPVDVPAFAEGKVKCWKDGENVVCSLRFQAADGKARVATMAAKPHADASEVAGWAIRSGVDPVTVLGVLPDLADVACGKRLVRDVAGAALKAQRRLDVCGMEPGDEPVLLTSEGDAGSAPLAALMHTEQRANAGDAQAQLEMARIRKAAQTPSGQKIAQPLLDASTARLAKANKERVQQTSFMARYSQMGLCL